MTTIRNTPPAPPLWIGIDTGGTFTDLVMVDTATGTRTYHKLPTTTGDPAKGILDGISEIVAGAGRKSAEVGLLVLGTTIATNAVLEGRICRTGMITTTGFRDVLELARQRRPHLFNLDIQKPAPPALRDCRFEVMERVGADGSVVEALDESAVLAAIDQLKAKEVEAVAVCFVHAYANPAHEARAAALVRERWPQAYVCASCDVLAEFREFERFATATINASLMPLMDRYMERFETGVAALGVPVAPRVMQSNGGAVTPDAVRRAPVNTFFSGPAGGAIAGVGMTQETGVRNLITFDMGGTSTDVCLIRDGTPAMKSVREMAGFPVRTRTIDIHTIGAGGGSIAWIDAGGLLKVGPMSAGAVPGPAAYGRGGERPTVTDANVVLGRLNPRALLGGRMPMFPDRARAVIEATLCGPLGRDVVAAAAGIVEIVNVNMMGAVRVISVEQGEDPRDFALVPFGGAGPLHAADIARNMGMRRVLVPPRPGILSAIGLIHADVRGDFSLTRLVRAEAVHLDALNAGLTDLAARGRAWLAAEGLAGEPSRTEWLAELRYFGQNFELGVPFADGRLDVASLAGVIAAFHRRHKEFYGYDMPGHPIELVTMRLSVVVDRVPPPAEARAADAAPGKPLETRPVWFPETGFTDTPVYERSALVPGMALVGPMIVEQMDATTVVPPGATVRVDAHGYLDIAVEPAITQPEKDA